MKGVPLMVEYLFYTDTYHGGSIPESEWPAYEARAAEQLAQYKRLYTVSTPDENAESMAICSMADAIAYFTAAVNGGGQLASVSVGSVSAGYASANAVDVSQKGQARELYRCASTYLEIYRGVG